MKFKSVGIITRSQDDSIIESIHQLLMILKEYKCDVMISRECSIENVSKINENEIPKTVDLLIAVGGDGTILHAANLSHDFDLPILGINRGQLGFLADLKPDEMQINIRKILDGDYTEEKRMMLKAEIMKANGELQEDRALNDIVLQRSETGRMLNFTTSVSNQYINNHAGDGIIIATPTGSTAYSMSCGGPIIDPCLDCYVMVPICPHTLSDRPLVLPQEKSIELELQQNNKNKAEITIDGRSICEFSENDKLVINKSKKETILIHPPGYDYYETLRTKLYWGQDIRIKKDK